MSDSRFIKVNGLTFRYLDYGGEGKPTIVFYHATGFVSELWEPVIRELQDRYHCLALDQRGHGGSDKAATEFSWRRTADDFLCFLEALELKHIIGIGHSSGATSIAVAAGRQPDLVNRAVLIEPTVRMRVVSPETAGQVSTLIERTRGRRSRWSNRETLYATLFARPPYASWTDEMKQLFADHAMLTHPNGEMELLCSPEIEASIYASFPQFDPWPHLEKVTQPMLVIHGIGPSVMPTTRVDELMPAMKSAQLVEMQEGGHLILMEAPQKVNKAIQSFLSRTEISI